MQKRTYSILILIVLLLGLSTEDCYALRAIVNGYDDIILSLTGPSVQGKVCNACTGEGIENVTVEFDKDGVEYQAVQTDADGIYPTIPSQGGPYPILFTAAGYLTKEIFIDLPLNSSVTDHIIYLLPNPGYQDCISGTITRTVLIGIIPKEIERGVQNIEVKLYQGDIEMGNTATGVGGNYHFSGLFAGTYRVEPVIPASECITTPLEYTSITVPISPFCDQDATPPWCSYDFELTCPETPPSTEPYWQEMVSNTTNLLHGIWGSSGSNIFAVGDNGVIMNYDGIDWSPQVSGSSENLKGVWGSSASNVYAVGVAGTVIKTTTGGDSWFSMTSNTSYGLNAIWGSTATDIFAVGDSGTIIYGDGTSWTLMDSGTQVKLLGVWGTSASDVYAVGRTHIDGYWKRTVLHYDGNPQLEWSEVPTKNGVSLMSLWGSSASDIIATGSFGVFIQYDGIGWQQIGGPTEKTLNGMWGSSGSNIYAVGFGGVIVHYDGTDWSVREPDVPHDLYGIWGASMTEIFAVGDNGTILVYDADADDDGAENDVDNCPEIPNPGQENSDEDGYGDVCDNCPTVINEDQADTYPFGGNGCGDACECEGSFDGDEDCDGGDAAAFKTDFGRSSFSDPCTIGAPCNGDFDCDADVDGADAALFKTDFGRSPFSNPCPNCLTMPWCTYQ